MTTRIKRLGGRRLYRANVVHRSIKGLERPCDIITRAESPEEARSKLERRKTVDRVVKIEEVVPGEKVVAEKEMAKKEMTKPSARIIGLEVELTANARKNLVVSVGNSFPVKDGLKAAGYRWNDRLVAWEKEVDWKPRAAKAEIDFIRSLDKEPQFSGQPHVLRALKKVGILTESDAGVVDFT